MLLSTSPNPRPHAQFKGPHVGRIRGFSSSNVVKVANFMNEVNIHRMVSRLCAQTFLSYKVTSYMFRLLVFFFIWDLPSHLCAYTKKGKVFIYDHYGWISKSKRKNVLVFPMSMVDFFRSTKCQCDIHSQVGFKNCAAPKRNSARKREHSAHTQLATNKTILQTTQLSVHPPIVRTFRDILLGPTKSGC